MRGVWRYFRMSELAGINSKEMHVATENTTLFLKQKPTAISERWQLNKADVNSLCEWSRKEREERETGRCCPNDLAIRIPRKTLPASIVLLFSTCISYLLSVKINQNDKWLREEGGRVLWKYSSAGCLQGFDLTTNTRQRLTNLNCSSWVKSPQSVLERVRFQQTRVCFKTDTHAQRLVSLRAQEWLFSWNHQSENSRSILQNLQCQLLCPLVRLNYHP